MTSSIYLYLFIYVYLKNAFVLSLPKPLSAITGGACL